MKTLATKIVAACVVAIAVASLTSGAFAQQRVRKNIDELSATELSDYLHALKMLQDRPSGQADSYAFFANLHNSRNVGPCEHARDTFLPWHRAHLLMFENALRAADPPRTANVTVPYWDWTKVPSGRRYPTAFESKAELGSGLTRNTTPICKTGQAPPSCQALPYTWQYMRDEVLSISTWSSSQSPNMSFGGASNLEKVCTARRDRGYGALESPSHNVMHDGYIGGLMARPSTAARDPIFYSFHSFIDLLWWQWQKNAAHETDTCLDCELCGTGMTVKQVIESEGQLNVTYEFDPQPTPVAVSDGVSKRFPHVPIDLALSATQDAIETRTIDVKIPNQKKSETVVLVNGVRITSPHSYQINAYFFPNSVEGQYDPRNRDFRKKYLAYVGSIWKSHHSDHSAEPARQTFAIDLTERVNALVGGQQGSDWKLRVELLVSPPPAGEPAAAINSDEREKIKKQLSFEALELRTKN